MSQDLQEKVAHWSKLLFNRLKICDYARLDWRMDKNGQPVLLEANPNCGWCEDGHLPKTVSDLQIYTHTFDLM